MLCRLFGGVVYLERNTAIGKVKTVSLLKTSTYLYKIAKCWLNDEFSKFYSYDEVETLIASLEAQAKLDQYEIDLARYKADLKVLLDWEAANTGAFLGWHNGDVFFAGTREEYSSRLMSALRDASK